MYVYFSEINIQCSKTKTQNIFIHIIYFMYFSIQYLFFCNSHGGVFHEQGLNSFSLGKNKSNINFFKNQILFKYVYVWFREDDQKMIFYYYILLLLV